MSGEGRNLYKAIYHVVRSFLAGGLFTKWVARKIMFYAREPCSSFLPVTWEGVLLESTGRDLHIKADVLRDLLLVTWGIRVSCEYDEDEFFDWENCDHKFYIHVTRYNHWDIDMYSGSDNQETQTTCLCSTK